MKTHISIQEKVRRSACAVAACLWLAGAGARSAAQPDRALDYAAEDAAYKTVRSLNAKDLAVTRLAFLGLFQDARGLAPVFRAGLLEAPGAFEFYTRNEVEWDRLVKEIEFGQRRSDVMDPETIQKFGAIQGVQALLYGDVREAARQPDGRARVRLTLKLAEVATGRILWSANIDGTYALPVAPPAPSPAVVQAVQRIAGEVSTSLQAAVPKITRGAFCNVFWLPLQGEGAEQFSDVLANGIVGLGTDRLHFYVKPAGDRAVRMVRRIAAELGDVAGAGSGNAQLNRMARISRQLEQLFEVSLDQKGAGAGTDATGAGAATPGALRNAVLEGRVVALDTGVGSARVTVTLALRSVPDWEQLWGGTFTGEVTRPPEPELTPRERIAKELEGYLTVRNILILAGALLGVALLAFLVKSMTRSR